jgi:hypothetical protein
MSSMYTPVSATNQGTLYALQMGPIKMVIDASVGARITEFSYNGTNVLTGPDVNTINYGSTFWPSPQSLWNWPPIAAIDTAAYTASIDSATNSIQMQSGTAALSTVTGSQFTVTKRFSPAPASGAIDVVYTLSNAANGVSISVAPWQISRVRGTGGLTFFGKGPGAFTNATQLQLVEQNSILWYTFAAATADSKALADGLGWIAHVTATRMVFLLSYPDIVAPDTPATGEAEVEIYTGPGGDYVEIEPQGPVTTLAAGVALSWTVRWKLRQLPDTIATATAGDSALATYAQQQLNQ